MGTRALSLVAVAAMLLAGPAFADTYLTIPTASYHFDRHRGYNEINVGAGVEHTINDDWRIAAGFYRNSIRKDSYYAGAVYAPWSFAGVKLGTAVGIVTGYGRPLPLATPTAMWEGREYGVNVVLIPPVGGKSGGVAFQLKRKF